MVNKDIYIYINISQGSIASMLDVWWER